MNTSLKPLDIARLGELQTDGSIRLYDAGRDYRRIRQASMDVMFLHSQGFIEVMSSNVSAAKTDGKDLIIRFHSGGVYRYHDQAKLFGDLMRSSSKGRFVHRKLKKSGIRFSKDGDMPLPSGSKPAETEAQADKRIEQEAMDYNIPVMNMLPFLLIGAGLMLKTINMTDTLMSLNLLRLKK